MTENPNVLPEFQAADAHRTTMLDLFAAVTNTCVNAKLLPVGVNVQHYDVYGGTDWMVNVHVPNSDTGVVDALTDAYGLAADDPEHGNYTRIGGTYVNGTPITVVVYCARPEQDTEVTA